MKSTFDRLAPFIQDYIYRNNWDELRDIQVKACEVIFDTDSNLLLSSGTASGKTEACFLPILSLIHSAQKTQSVDVVYISPLKALINDQFERLEDLLIEADIPVFKWHGDVAFSKKNKLVTNPNGILQITPESLQGLIMNYPGRIITLFSQLKFIVIDEIHYFMDNDRGIQLLSILEQIQRLINIVPRRIGLSATLGELEAAEKWLCTGTDREVISPISISEKRKIKLSINRFEIEKEREKEIAYKFYNYLFDLTLGKKCILYTSSRNDVEKKIFNLKKMATLKKYPDVYHVHHGSLAKELREDVEKQMKFLDMPIVVGATLTLELGIDIGSLDRIIQIGSPMTASSFVQRLGRTGRRSNAGEMYFVHAFQRDDSSIEKQIDWDFLKSIAIILLYTKDKWVEPIRLKTHNFGILYHQTMCYLKRKTEASPRELIDEILSLSIFSSIDSDDYLKLLKYMLEIEHLEYTEDKKIIIGLKAEYMVNHFSFLAVFDSNEEFTVKKEMQTLGTVDEVVPIGELLILGGKTWRVMEVDSKSKTIYVNLASKEAGSPWIKSVNIKINTVIVKKIKEILESKQEYPFLSASAKEYLEQAREETRVLGILYKAVHKTGEKSHQIFPWIGTEEMLNLSYKLKDKGIENKVKHLSIEILNSKYNENDLNKILIDCKKEQLYLKNIDISESDLAYINGKFSKYVPQELLEKQFKLDFLL